MSTFSDTRTIGEFQRFLGASSIEVKPSKSGGYYVVFARGNEVLKTAMIAKEFGKTLTPNQMVSWVEGANQTTGEVVKGFIIHKKGTMAESVASYDFSAVEEMSIS